MRFIGIDLAWQGEKNPSALAVGSLCDRTMRLESLEPALVGFNQIVQSIKKYDGLKGIAIDAPTIINNHKGQRECEKSLSQIYASRKAACYPTNKSLYPNALSVQLSEALSSLGFTHVSGKKWQIECYPHPSIIECFGLKERLAYKKGNVASKKAGQIQLAKMIDELQNSKVLSLQIAPKLKYYLSKPYIESLKGQSLKSNEDALDSIICLYIAGLHHSGVSGTLFGDPIHGFIWVPQVKCVY
jgi:predicted RNase H-like nuclease